MPYEVIKNFQGGLDTRKFFLALPAGTLTQLVNGHITQGGEIEKRKAFVPTTIPANTFDGVSVPTGITVFGSMTPGSVAVAPTSSTPGVAGTFPSPFIYQQLIHPAVLNGTAYAGANHALTALVSSDLFGNYAFVSAQFADGTSWCYYNGVFVPDFAAGIVLAYLAGSNTLIAKNLLELLQATAGYALSVQATPGPILDIIGPVGDPYTTVVLKSSALGTITPQIKNTGLAATNGVQSVGSFQIVAGGAETNNFVSVVKISTAGGGTVVANLLSAAVNWQTTIFDTAIAVANNISGNAGNTGYYAVASSTSTTATVNIYPLAVGTSTNNYNITVTVNKPTGFANICIGNCALAFSGAGSGGAFAVTSLTVGGGSNLLTGGVSAASLNAMAQGIATAINAGASVYCACAVGATVYLSKDVTSSTDASLAVVATPGTGITVGGVTGGGTTISLTQDVVGAVLAFTGVVVRNGGVNNFQINSASGSVTTAPVSVIIGGVTNAPYTYSWKYVSGSTGVKINSPTTYQTTFSPSGSPPDTLFVDSKYTAGTTIDGTNKPANVSDSATFECVVTDASSNTYTSETCVVTLTVSFATG